MRVEVWRGALIESRHRVRVAVVDGDGHLRAVAGDVDEPVFARSAVKPLQALPLVEDGGLARFGFVEPELALTCASHGGEPRHVETAMSMLARIGVEPEALACGPQAPTHAPSAVALQAAGIAPSRLHNNCSGKHAGMLALASMHGWPLNGYERAKHPVQRRMLGTISQWTEVPVDGIGTGVDGCGVVTFAVALRSLAGAFARVAAAARRVTAEPAAAQVVGAMTHHPGMIAGEARLCTALMQVTEGRIFAKYGAEGVYCAGVPGAELGLALKVEDGSRRAAEVALLAVLRVLGVLGEEEMAALSAYAEPDVTNTRGEVVGRIRADVDLEARLG